MLEVKKYFFDDIKPFSNVNLFRYIDCGFKWSYLKQISQVRVRYLLFLS